MSGTFGTIGTGSVSTDVILRDDCEPVSSGLYSGQVTIYIGVYFSLTSTSAAAFRSLAEAATKAAKALDPLECYGIGPHRGRVRRLTVDPGENDPPYTRPYCEAVLDELTKWANNITDADTGEVLFERAPEPKAPELECEESGIHTCEGTARTYRHTAARDGDRGETRVWCDCSARQHRGYGCTVEPVDGGEEPKAAHHDCEFSHGPSTVPECDGAVSLYEGTNMAAGPDSQRYLCNEGALWLLHRDVRVKLVDSTDGGKEPAKAPFPGCQCGCSSHDGPLGVYDHTSNCGCETHFGRIYLCEKCADRHHSEDAIWKVPFAPAVR